jgi:hypothetical protein
MGDNHGFSRLTGASRFHWAKPVCGEDGKMKIPCQNLVLVNPGRRSLGDVNGR